MKSILAIDLSALFHQAYEATKDQPLSAPKQVVLDTIGRIRRIAPESLPVICCDSKKNWRKAVDPTYKAQREAKPATFYEELNRLKERLVKDALPVLEFEGYEADDVIASLMKYDGGIVASPDKDLLQLTGPDVSQLRTHEMYMSDGVTPKLWNPEMVLNTFGVTPNKLRDYLAIVGDVSDNVIGIEGVGGKGAAALIAEFGDVETLCKVIDTAREFQPRSVLDASPPPLLQVFSAKKTLNRWKGKLDAYFANPKSTDKLRANLVLVSLKHDCPIDFDDLFKKRKPQTLMEAGDKTQSEVAREKEEIESRAIDTSIEIAGLIADVATPKKEIVETKAIATVDPLTQFDGNLQPTGMAGAWWLAKRAVDAGLYTKFAKPETALMVMLRGKDYGLSDAAALEMLQPVEGRVTAPSQLLQTMARRHPDCEYFYFENVSSDAATAVTKRKGTPVEERCTYTVEQARIAGLVKPRGGWEKNPEDMCIARAGAKLARRVYPDATSGAYSFEEME